MGYENFQNYGRGTAENSVQKPILKIIDFYLFNANFINKLKCKQ